MGLSSLLLMGSLVAGVAAGLLWWRFNWLTAAVAGAGVWFMTSLAAQRLHNLDFFGLIHIVYLVAVVSVPLASVVGALGRWRNPAFRRSSVSLLMFSATAVSVGVYATHVEPFWLQADQVEVRSDDVTESFRVAVLSDIQNTRVGDYERDAIDQIIAAEPDLVLMAGDLWQLDPALWPERRGQFAELIKRLVEGVPLLVMVEGHGDFISGYDWLVQEAGGGVVLWDEGIETEVKGQTVRIGGLALHADLHPRRADVLDFVTEDQAGFSILLAHTPDVVFELDGPNGAVPDLVVAGHTHGGQVALPFIGPPITFSQVPASAGAGGLHEVNGAQLYITTGIGVEREQAPQVRFGARPSFGLIEVVPAAE